MCKNGLLRARMSVHRMCVPACVHTRTISMCSCATACAHTDIAFKCMCMCVHECFRCSSIAGSHVLSCSFLCLRVSALLLDNQLLFHVLAQFLHLQRFYAGDWEFCSNLHVHAWMRLLLPPNSCAHVNDPTCSSTLLMATGLATIMPSIVSDSGTSCMRAKERDLNPNFNRSRVRLQLLFVQLLAGQQDCLAGAT